MSKSFLIGMSNSIDNEIETKYLSFFLIGMSNSIDNEIETEYFSFFLTMGCPIRLITKLNNDSQIDYTNGIHTTSVYECKTVIAIDFHY